MENREIKFRIWNGTKMQYDIMVGLSTKEMRQYKVDFYGYVYFKIKTEKDITKLIKEYMIDQNKGEPKYDRLYLKEIKALSEKEFNDLDYMDYTNIIT